MPGLTEWGVVLVLATLVALVSTFTKSAYNLSAVIQKLSTTLEQLQKTVYKIDASNAVDHSRIFDVLGQHETKLARHDERIENLERKTK